MAHALRDQGFVVRSRRHHGRVRLPSGVKVSPEPVAATSLAEESGRPFFVLALPDIWRQHPAFSTVEMLEAAIVP